MDKVIGQWTRVYILTYDFSISQDSRRESGGEREGENGEEGIVER